MARLFGESWRSDARRGGQISVWFRDEKKESTIVTVLTAAVNLKHRGGGGEAERTTNQNSPLAFKGMVGSLSGFYEELLFVISCTFSRLDLPGTPRVWMSQYGSS